jgi:regulator of sirC expression with transglutaminase-like and TPR domain
MPNWATQEAVQDLETYLAHAEDGLDADMVAERLNALRRSLVNPQD